MTTPILRCGFPVQPVIIDNHPRKLPYRDCGAVAAYRVVASLWGTRKTLGYTCVEHKLTPHAGVLWRIEEVEE